MKWSEFIKLAKKKGWYFWKSGGKHDHYKHPDREDVLVVERHQSQEIKKGLQSKLMKQIGEDN